MNQSHLKDEVRRLRLILQRRVLWLRSIWQHKTIEELQSLVISEAQADSLLAVEDHQAEAQFYRQDPEALKTSRAIDELEHLLVECAQAMAEANTPLALDMLVQLFGLTPFERNVLLLCVAPELDPTFEPLYAYVQDDVMRKYVTPSLAFALFCDSPESETVARNSLLPEAALRHFRLVSLEPGSSTSTRSTSRMSIDERIFNYIRGVNQTDRRVLDLLRSMPPPLIPPSHHDLVDKIALLVQSSKSSGSLPTLNLFGPPGAGKQETSHALCHRLGLQLYSLDIGRLPAPGPERHEALSLLERETVLLQMALYLDADEIELHDKAAMASITDVIERLGGFLIVGSRERWQAEREMIALRIPKIDLSAQRAVWEQALDGMGDSLNGHIDAIVQQFDFGPQSIIRAIIAGKVQALMRSSDDGVELTADDLWQACREQASWHMGDLAQHIMPCYVWEDIILPSDVFRQLCEIATQVAIRPMVYESWGFGAGLNRGRGINALFSGPSGTGKTMAAEVLANHLKLDLYRIDLAGVVSKYIGETEKNLRKVFDAAEQSGAILFFDEADALFGKRSEVKDSHDRYSNIEINYLLQRMEDYRGLAVLATNRKTALDRAFMRRLRFLVDFPFPDADNRRHIWQKVFPTQTPLCELDYEALSRLELAGGNIRNVALNAAFLAASENTPISMAHIMHAARREYAKIDKMVTQGELGAYYRLVKR